MQDKQWRNVKGKSAAKGVQQTEIANMSVANNLGLLAEATGQQMISICDTWEGSIRVKFNIYSNMNLITWNVRGLNKIYKKKKA